MPTYRADFVDHGENIYRTDHVEHEDDEAAIRHAARRNPLGAAGGGFDIWQDDRLVHIYRHAG
jgi:hypothetical protein